MALEGTTLFCFGASYAVALALELSQLLRPGNIRRFVTYGFAAAGLIAHTIYLTYYPTQQISPLFLSWILAVFYLYGSIHHRHQAWGVFVLPVVLVLVLVAAWGQEAIPFSERIGTDPWIFLHVAFLVVGAVGVCVGFIASVMYLFQSWRLKHKTAPGEGIRLLSLERLEDMNRRAITLAFPLFTVGLFIGFFLNWNKEQLSWFDPKIVSTGILWLVFLVLLYLRYGLHVRGRRVAIGTIAAFIFLLVAFTVQYVVESSHPSGGGS